MEEDGVNLSLMMAEKAQEIFLLIDQENKGFITKNDLFQLESELPQTPEQLEDVFNNLDLHGKGYLTLDEFTEGFGSFLGLKNSNSSILRTEIYEDDLSDVVFPTESHNFDDMIKDIGASDLLQDIGIIKSLWIRLSQNQPEMLDNFEDFLRRITSELKRTQMNYRALHTSMDNKRFAHNEEIQALYLEMESQISAEKERIRAEEKAKERVMRERLESELMDKDRRLQELLAYQNEMEKKLTEMNAIEILAKNENEKLLKEKAEVEEMLDSSTLDLEESKSRIVQLRQLQRERSRMKSLAAMQINEWIGLERESLLRQLQELKEVNRRLLDNQDELESQHHGFNSRPHSRILTSMTEDSYPRIREDLVSQKSDDRPDAWCYTQTSEALGSDSTDGQNESIGSLIASAGYREQPIGSSCSSDSIKDEIDSPAHNISVPQRLYKVVFVGDSGVGKSSFIYRICKQSFISSFATTIGVDFQVHSVKLDDQIVALQLWDTAGQERFRSVTKQYFRKADGVLVMYDVTCDVSFRSVREWLEGIKESVEKETVIVIVGNKLDAMDNMKNKVVSSRHGKDLANEYGALFFETSAKSGFNVNESVQQMAGLLRDREDKELKLVQDLTTLELKKPPIVQNKCCKF